MVPTLGCVSRCSTGNTQWTFQPNSCASEELCELRRALLSQNELLWSENTSEISFRRFPSLSCRRTCSQTFQSLVLTLQDRWLPPTGRRAGRWTCVQAWGPDRGVWVTGTQGNSQGFWAELGTSGCDLSTGVHAGAVGVRGGPPKCAVDTWCSWICVVSAGLHCPVSPLPRRGWWPRPADSRRDSSVRPYSRVAVIAKSLGDCPNTAFWSWSGDVAALDLFRVFWPFQIQHPAGCREGTAGRHGHPRAQPGPGPTPACQQRFSSPCLGFLLCEQAANSAGLLRVWEGRRDPVSCAAVWK